MNSTASATTSHTYAAAGTYAASLQVRNEIGELSKHAYLPIVVGDGLADDTDLFISSGSVGLNAGTDDADSVTFSGILNPAGLPASASGARMILRINGEEVGGGFDVSSARAQARAATSIALLSPSTGKFKVTAKGVDLQDTTGVDTSLSAKKAVRMEVEVEVTDTTIDTPKAKAVINVDFTTKAEKSGKGKFNFISLPTFTGVFKSQRTSAKEGQSGGYSVSASGPVQAEFSGAVDPTGDLTVTIGGDGTPSSGATFTVPRAALQQGGAGEKTTWTYSSKLQAVDELKKFQINNGSRKFVLTTNEIAGTLIPASGGGNTSFDLLIQIVVPTARGPLTLTTTVEIQRSAATSGSWKR